MAIVIGFLTFVLVVVSLFLILLVLVQLPKKEAGVGMAFGAGMSEMLLGAGSGNVLTRITKYTVGMFLCLALLLSILISSQSRKSGLGISRAIEEQARSTPRPAAAPVTPSAPPAFQPLLPPSNAITALTTDAAPSTGAIPLPAPLISTTIVVNPNPGAPTTPATPAPVPSVPTPNKPGTN